MRPSLTLACAAAIACAVPAVAAVPAKAAVLPWLHVAHPSGGLPQITDDKGRTVLLRGVNLVGLEDDFYRSPSGAPAGPKPFWSEDPADYANGKCPTNSHASAQPPVCQSDLVQMHSLGFNVIRLAVSWSRLEPTPGSYNKTYVDRIAQVVGWARQQGIYTLIDMHEDAYSRFTPETAPVTLPGGLIGAAREGANHADGAPPWAVIANGVPAETLDGTAELNAFVESAFTSFWLDLTPPGVHGSLQTHYIGAMSTLMRRFAKDPSVVGYEVMNEPLPGFIPPGLIDQGYLFPFYDRLIKAMTDQVHDSLHLVFVEPIVLRNLTDFAVGLSAPFTSYPNLVYAPHVYTHVFTADTFVPAPASSVIGAIYPLGYGQAMTTAVAEAKALHAALLIGEYGNSNSADSTQLAAETAQFDTAAISSTLWQWKSNCGEGQSAAQCGPGQWSMYYGSAAKVPAHDAGPIPSRVEYVARAYPRGVVGTLISMKYEPVSVRFTLTARAMRAGGDTVIYVPARAHGGAKVAGSARLTRIERASDGSRLLHVSPTGSGEYAISVG